MVVHRSSKGPESEPDGRPSTGRRRYVRKNGTHLNAWTVRRRSGRIRVWTGARGIVLEPGWCLNQRSRLGHLGPLWVEDRASDGNETATEPTYVEQLPRDVTSSPYKSLIDLKKLQNINIRYLNLLANIKGYFVCDMYSISM